ncbi:propanediol dehydratase large subunit [Klebsiella pneumoniae subsp. ozaenae]|uniref:Propanediol dehydratase large subunit n=1 Tax=Klebsiella pneumoniae subsp. ozaenae TaxID=574 RepID=A0A378AHM7_KLEPO|nr:propanediol dehydratase large subunit [Klebsiella pneumoniae subsp. ozaenae]
MARYAPFNAIALLVGSQVGRPGVLTQCSLEEATELKLGMLGHTCYAETISVYGTERCLPMAMTPRGRKASSPPPTPRAA